MNKEIYQMIAYLLKYPTEEMAEVLPEIQTEIENIDNKQIKKKINLFINQSRNFSLDEWIHHYVQYFDFGRLTNLYVTYLKLGEQRERGLELLKLKKYYEAHGFHVTDKELPDYLPIILEFCAHVPVEISNELLSMYGKAIHEIQTKLREQNSFYHHLFVALFLQMKTHDLSISFEETM